MASLKEMRDRIGSVKATQKITKAMQMVENPPARPLSAVATTTRCFWSAPVPVIRRGPSSPTPAARLAMTEAIRDA